MKKILLSIVLLSIALPIYASTYNGELQGCVVEKYIPTSEMRQTLDYAYDLLDELDKINNPDWTNTLDSIRSQLDCIKANFIN